MDRISILLHDTSVRRFDDVESLVTRQRMEVQHNTI